MATRPSSDCGTTPAILHPERFEDSLAHESRQRRAASARDQHSQYFGAHVIQPPLARVIGERQASETLHELIGSSRERECAERQARFDKRPLQRAHRREEGNLAVSGAERQKVTYGDRALGGHGIVELAVDRPQDPPVRQFRQESINRIVEPQPAFFDENHRGDGSDRLRHRSQAEERIRLHSRRAIEAKRANGIDVLRTSPTDHRNEAGQLTAINMTEQGFVQPRQPRGR